MLCKNPSIKSESHSRSLSLVSISNPALTSSHRIHCCGGLIKNMYTYPINQMKIFSCNQFVFCVRTTLLTASTFLPLWCVFCGVTCIDEIFFRFLWKCRIAYCIKHQKPTYYCCWSSWNSNKNIRIFVRCLASSHAYMWVNSKFVSNYFPKGYWCWKYHGTWYRLHHKWNFITKSLSLPVPAEFCLLNLSWSHYVSHSCCVLMKIMNDDKKILEFSEFYGNSLNELFDIVIGI